MRKIRVRLKDRGYDIVIGRGLLAETGRLLKPLCLGSKVLVVTNRLIGRHFFKTVQAALKRSRLTVARFDLPHGDERDKSEPVLHALWRIMASIPLERSSTLVALGGGVVGDLAGFAAATYMRGINLIQIPTTLLAQVDSSIGGKTAIDLPQAKNIIGSFYHPRMVISDVNTLGTLSLRELRNAFSEVIKYGVIRDPILFRMLEQKTRWFFRSRERGTDPGKVLRFLEQVVWRSAKIKARVVEQDERETKGARMILNYGHTFAHAFEGASGFRMPHGAAVAIGMSAAGRLAQLLGRFPAEHQIRQLRLIREAGLPVRWNGRKLSDKVLLNFMKRDKKVRSGRLRFVLPRRIGKVIVRERIPEHYVRTVLNQL